MEPDFDTETTHRATGWLAGAVCLLVVLTTLVMLVNAFAPDYPVIWHMITYGGRKLAGCIVLAGSLMYFIWSVSVWQKGRVFFFSVLYRQERIFAIVMVFIFCAAGCFWVLLAGYLLEL